MHADNAGNPLEIGLKVLYLRPWYKTMEWGIIFGHTPKMVRMENGDLQKPEYIVVPKDPNV